MAKFEYKPGPKWQEKGLNYKTPNKFQGLLEMKFAEAEEAIAKRLEEELVSTYRPWDNKLANRWTNAAAPEEMAWPEESPFLDFVDLVKNIVGWWANDVVSDTMRRYSQLDLTPSKTVEEPEELDIRASLLELDLT